MPSLLFDPTSLSYDVKRPNGFGRSSFNRNSLSAPASFNRISLISSHFHYLSFSIPSIDFCFRLLSFSRYSSSALSSNLWSSLIDETFRKACCHQSAINSANLLKSSLFLFPEKRREGTSACLPNQSASIMVINEGKVSE